MSISSCTNKREVLNRVKEVLEPHAQSGVIDREDLKELAKKSTEVVAPPVAVKRVDQITLQQLVIFLDENDVEGKVIAPIREALAALEAAEENEGKKEQQQTEALKATAGFSLSAFQARMMRKREELRRHREKALVTVEETPNSDVPAATTSVVSSVLCADTQHSKQMANGEPPVRRCKTEAHTPLSLPLPALQDFDLYADLVDSTAGGWCPTSRSMPM